MALSTPKSPAETLEADFRARARERLGEVLGPKMPSEPHGAAAAERQRGVSADGRARRVWVVVCTQVRSPTCDVRFSESRRRVAERYPTADCHGTSAFVFMVFRAERAISAATDQPAWVVIDEDFVLQPEANSYLAALRARDRSVNTERVYAGRIALYLSYCRRTGVGFGERQALKP